MITKTHPNDLASFGGKPAFESALHVGRPNIGNREKILQRVNDILDRRWLSNGGRYVREFEDGIAKIVGVKHCVVVANATIALEIAARVLGLQGEVIIPSFTFVASAHALQWIGVTPVFCDIDPYTYNIDPQKIEQLITPRTSALMGVHVYGRACDCDALEGIARNHNLKLFYDAAHAFGCSHKGTMIGGFGDLEVFSFHATKFLNSLEGGAIVTNDDELARKARIMTNFGFTDYDHVDSIGTNGKMNEVSAAMGLTNLESMSEFVNVNYRNYKQYQKELDGLKAIRFVTYNEAERNNYQYVVLEVDDVVAGISRNQLTQLLHKENILARRYFYPGCHRMQPYLSLFPNVGLRLPETERVTERMLCLPTGTAVSAQDVCAICATIKFILKESEAIRQLLIEAK